MSTPQAVDVENVNYYTKSFLLMCKSCTWDSNVLRTEMNPDGLESTPLVDRMPNSVKSNETAFICGHPNDPIPKLRCSLDRPDWVLNAFCNFDLSYIMHWEGFCEEVGRFGAFLVFSRPQKPLKTVLLGSALSLSMPVFSQWRRRLEKFLRCNRKRFFYVKTQTQIMFRCFDIVFL